MGRPFLYHFSAKNRQIRKGPHSGTRALLNNRQDGSPVSNQRLKSADVRSVFSSPSWQAGRTERCTVSSATENARFQVVMGQKLSSMKLPARRWRKESPTGGIG